MAVPFKHRLHRLSRIHVADPVFFVTSCVEARRAVLASDPVHEILFDEWHAADERHGWVIGPYVIMPDHVHFFCRRLGAPESKSLSGFLGKWKEWTSKRILGEIGRPAPLWQEGFFDHILRSSESTSEKLDYMRMNPVRGGLVAQPEDWPFQGWVHFQ